MELTEENRGERLEMEFRSAWKVVQNSDFKPEKERRKR
jgi:hypothetical protein